ncbi:hypothetical protein KQH42_23725 [Streptomyces sp. CHA1]|uniref:hypothetical protein n=1 Tax=unclassified Streptomyces TaxID=2593676 RepID=UPI00131A1ED5|nr:hypothetical protein [Streptomyces sp. CHB9.2]MCO6733362.1 hypothetical protein [Streptomyces sp. EL9]MCO6745262.1 hypothetical protein [Streptomyces sp. CHA1]
MDTAHSAGPQGCEAPRRQPPPVALALAAGEQVDVEVGGVRVLLRCVRRCR